MESGEICRRPSPPQSDPIRSSTLHSDELLIEYSKPHGIYGFSHVFSSRYDLLSFAEFVSSLVEPVTDFSESLLCSFTSHIDCECDYGD